MRKPRQARLRLIALAVALAMVCAACGGSDGDGADASVDPPANSSEPTGGDNDSDAEDSANNGDTDDSDSNAEGGDSLADNDGDGIPDSAVEIADDIADSVEAAQAAVGGGGFTITVGDQTWNFDRVLCAFGEEEIGQEGAEFVLSSIQDGLQAYVSLDSFGPSVSVDDIEDFANPSVGLSAFGNAEINLDGKSVSGTGDFLDSTSDSFETVPGTFSGTCP